MQCCNTSLVHSVADNPPPPPGLGVKGQKKFLYPQSASNSRPFNKFHFVPEENFSDVGGWSARAGQEKTPKPPWGY